jgi:type I restriction enzyme R subunit
MLKGKKVELDGSVPTLNNVADIKNNTVKDFEFSYFDDIDDALIEGLSQNQDFFSLLLGNDDIKKEVLGIFTEEIYKSLREA